MVMLSTQYYSLKQKKIALAFPEFDQHIEYKVRDKINQLKHLLNDVESFGITEQEF